MNVNCCNIEEAIVEAADDCTGKKGGAYNWRICCVKNLAYTEDNCLVDGGLNAKITDIDTIDLDGGGGPAPMFFTMAVKDKAGEYKWSSVYDPASGGIKLGEEVNLVFEMKTRAFYCTIQKWVGQQVAILFQERGSNRWYLAGRKGGLRVINVAGGTGTDTFTPTTVQIVGEDVDAIFLQVFDTDDATTEALIDSQVAA